MSMPWALVQLGRLVHWVIDEPEQAILVVIVIGISAVLLSAVL
jgi:hypothetical protein